MSHSAIPNSESALRIILVDTETPGNLGASARAMKSMGLTQLRLINPTGRQSGEAIARAVSARDVLIKATEYANLSEAIADCNFVIGTSGKIAGLDLPRYTPREAARLLWSAECAQIPYDDSALEPLVPAIILGRESQGLTREELSLCHGYITIPTHPSCPSLNLASALQVITYEHFVWRTQSHRPDTDPVSLAPSRQRAHLLSLIERLAIKVGALNPEHPRQMSRRLSEFLARAHPRCAEVSILQSIIGRALTRLGAEED